MARNIDASELGDAANDLKQLEARLRTKYGVVLSAAATQLTGEVSDTAPTQQEPDGKTDQIALSNSFGWFNRGAYSISIGSSAPHAIPVETGWDYGDWQIPDEPTGVAWTPDDNKYFLPNVGGYYDKETGKVYYPQVNVGRYKGANYAQRATRRQHLEIFDEFDEQTKQEIVKAGFKPD